ncbi:MAG TPA: GFA family protein [Gaiellales bacterium]|nr:GFA family protein [Gaiellales bacterium]
MLKGRCDCRAVEYEVADEFIVAYICHCSNCRAATGSAFLPWGEIEAEKLRVTRGADKLRRLWEQGPDHEMRCSVCWSRVYWTRTAAEGRYVRVPYGTLVDEPACKPMAHMFVGSKAPWYEILDDLPQHEAYPWS